MDLQISSLVDSLMKTNAFLVHVICATETVTIKGVYINIIIIIIIIIIMFIDLYCANINPGKEIFICA